MTEGRDDALEDMFQGVMPKSDYYPGSKVKRKAVSERAVKTKQSEGWDADPVILKLKGVDTEFFTVAHLGAAVHRKARTMRKWEEDGHIPKADWRSPGDTIHAQKRLYSRAQVEGILAIAIEEHLMDDSPPKISNTRFPQRVHALFAELRRV